MKVYVITKAGYLHKIYLNKEIAHKEMDEFAKAAIKLNIWQNDMDFSQAKDNTNDHSILRVIHYKNTDSTILEMMDLKE